MWVDWQTIITAGAVLTAVVAIIGALFKGHKWYLETEAIKREVSSMKEERKREMNELRLEFERKMSALKDHHNEDVKHIKEESALICFGLAACMDGLIQLGANHSVPEAKEKLEKYLNKQAHE